ncbi:MAG: DivIVA domain-containing protein [Ornithinimicrobium sp.]
MILIILILGVLALGVIVAVIVSRSAIPGVEAPVSTQSYAGLPPGPVHSSDLDGVRLDLAFRGYRMDQVDAVLDRLRQELVSRDQEIDRLRAQEDHHGDL